MTSASPEALLNAREQEEIGRDLSAFADPGTTIEWVNEPGMKGSVARWEAQGSVRSAQFLYGPARKLFVSTRSTQKLQTYGQFLASVEMADLRLLAQIMVQSQRGTRTSVFVSPQAAWAESPRAVGPAMSLFTDAVDGSTADARTGTSVLFLTADAGVGKTSLLRELVAAQARRYLAGATDRLLLYVDAQGQALSRFDDALAVSLQDLRSRFTYHALASLVHHNLIVPVVDGFDELIGKKGVTDDAFQSLSGFLERLDGEGAVIASARDVYFELEFSKRAEAESELRSWNLRSLQLQGWTASQVSEYVTRIAERRGHLDADGLGRRLEEEFQSAEAADLRGKPFFVASAVDLLLDDVTLDAGGDFLNRLVRAYLARESETKLLLPRGDKILDAAALGDLFVEIALEMWRQETRELDSASVREVVELFGTAAVELDDEALRVLTERAPTLAMLGRGTRAGSVVFEHEILFSFFLAKALAQRLVSSPRLLSRGSLPVEAARRLVSLLLETVSPQEVLDALSAAARRDGPGQGQVRANAGLLAAALLCAGAGDGVVIRDVVIGDAPLSEATLERVTFENVEFLRTDLSSARWTGCIVRNCLFKEVLVDPRVTRLGLRPHAEPDAQFAGLRVVEGESVSLLWDPAAVHDVLVEIGARTQGTATPDDAQRSQTLQERIHVVERICTAFTRGTLLAFEDDPRLRGVVSSAEWPAVRDAMLEYGLMTAETRSASGPRKEFYRRHFQTELLLLGLSGPTGNAAFTDFWRRLGVAPQS